MYTAMMHIVCIEILVCGLKNQELNQIGSNFHTKRALTSERAEYDLFLKKVIFYSKKLK